MDWIGLVLGKRLSSRQGGQSWYSCPCLVCETMPGAFYVYCFFCVVWVVCLLVYFIRPFRGSDVIATILILTSLPGCLSTIWTWGFPITFPIILSLYIHPTCTCLPDLVTRVIRGPMIIQGVDILSTAVNVHPTHEGGHQRHLLGVA